MTRMIATRVLVLGEGVAALLATRGLARDGHPVLLLTPGDRLSPDAAGLMSSETWALDEVVEEIGSLRAVEVVSGGRLLKMSGTAGFLQAWVEEPGGEEAEYTVGAVVMAQGPPMGPDVKAAPEATAEYQRLAQVLGLKVNIEGDSRPLGAHAWPIAQSRDGVYLVGPAKGMDTLVSQLDEMERMLLAIGKLLGREREQAPVE